MNYTETTLTARDGLPLFLRMWTPDLAPASGQAPEPRGVLVLVHGLGEHAGRYPHVVAAFAQRGYVIYGHDHRGFGRSGGKRGDYKQFDDVITDLDQVVTFARQTYPNLPVFLYAHSLGGMYATHYLARHQAKIRAALLSAPGYGPGPDFNPTLIRLARILARLTPGLTLNTGGSKDFRLSHDPEVKKAYEQDALRHDLVTARFAWTNLQKATEAGQVLATLRLPLLIILGAEDTTINRQAITDAVAKAGANVTFRYYPCFHELHNELAELREPVLADTLAWFEDRGREA